MELLLAGSVWRTVFASLCCVVRHNLLEFWLSSNDVELNFTNYGPCFCAGFSDPSVPISSAGDADAGRMTKDDRRNPRIFNSLKFAANVGAASGREICSRWNSSRPQTSRRTRLTACYNASFVSGCGATRFFFSGIEAIAFQVAVQTGASDSQELRSPQPVSLAHLQHALHVHFAHLFERQRFPVIVPPRARLRPLQLFRQIRQIDEISRRRYARAGNDILQFAHIARPPVP